MLLPYFEDVIIILRIAVAALVGLLMSRFFFHLTDGNRIFTDANGVELRNRVSVRKYVNSHIQEIRGALSESGIHVWTDWAIIVSNDKNEILEVLGLDLKPKFMAA